MAWHQQDPVDETERKLQQRIAQQMGHANDFVTGKKVWQLNYKASGFGLTKANNQTLAAALTQGSSGQVVGNKTQ